MPTSTLCHPELAKDLTAPPGSLGLAPARWEILRRLRMTMGALVELHDRADLHRAVLRAGDLGRVRDRLVKVLAVKKVVPAKLLLRLGEWAVRHHALAVTDADRSGGGDRLERLAALQHALVTDLLRERKVAGHHFLALVG